jgi:hypothetical protein
VVGTDADPAMLALGRRTSAAFPAALQDNNRREARCRDLASYGTISATTAPLTLSGYLFDPRLRSGAVTAVPPLIATESASCPTSV